MKSDLELSKFSTSRIDLFMRTVLRKGKMGEHGQESETKFGEWLTFCASHGFEMIQKSENALLTTKNHVLSSKGS